MNILRRVIAFQWNQVEIYRNSAILLLAFLALYSFIEITLNINRPYWGDESHFVETVRVFGQGLDLNLLKHYDEMSTPLPFVMYAAWGKVVGFQTQSLRILSVFVALITYFSFHHLLFAILRDGRIALLGTIFLALNPYMLAFSIFVFTDMLAIFFLTVACTAIRNQNPRWLAIAMAGALWCRQYLFFLNFAAAVYYLFRLWKEKRVYPTWREIMWQQDADTAATGTA
ncbi:MAG: glycosyltransferase family 39 protein [Chloroflexi bacterium]|nr:glycosyltransferase family 39 protein [Chloroflexota bacterium]